MPCFVMVHIFVTLIVTSYRQSCSRVRVRRALRVGVARQLWNKEDHFVSFLARKAAKICLRDERGAASNF